jgi:mono/diheme cytochrome c family protein
MRGLKPWKGLMQKQRSLPRRILRIAGLTACGAAVVTAAAVGAVWISSELTYNRKHPLEAAAAPARLEHPHSLAEGARLVRIYGCTDCHGEGLQGKLFQDDLPIGRLYGPNLTRTAQRYSDAQLRAAVTHGVAADGRGLWVMPSSVFAKLDERALQGIIGYIRSLPAEGQQTQESWMGPVARLGMVLGKFRSEPVIIAEGGAPMPLAVGSNHELGRQLAAVACGECHGPKLEGDKGALGTPDLTVARAYDLAAFRTLMKTGASLTGRDLGLMSTSAKIRYSALTDAEVEQLHAYLLARARKVAG